MVDENYNNNMEKRINSCQEADVRKGPWTMEEDLILINYIGNHGEGVWNNLARSAGLNRTGKSCRLRWLNYLRPDVRRGNITPEEQVLIMDLHSRWGNRWSKIAKHLPGRTDNEIKNYWRTRIQKKVKNGETMEFHNSIVGDEASTSTSQTNSMEDNYVTQPIINNYLHDQINQVNINNNNNNFHDHDHHAMTSTTQFSNDSSDNFWAVDDFWSNYQSLNGDN